MRQPRLQTSKYEKKKIKSKNEQKLHSTLIYVYNSVIIPAKWYFYNNEIINEQQNINE